MKIVKISTFSKKKPQCLVLALAVENLGKPFVRNQFYDDLYYILPSNPLKLPIQQYTQCQAFQLILVESNATKYRLNHWENFPPWHPVDIFGKFARKFRDRSAQSLRYICHVLISPNGPGFDSWLAQRFFLTY